MTLPAPLRLVGMILLVLVFGVSSYISYKVNSETSRAISTSVKVGAWAASELEGEFTKFDYALLEVAAGQGNLDRLILRYDLLWSRIETLLTGEETATVRSDRQSRALLDELMVLVRRIEPTVMNLAMDDRQGARALIAQLAPYRHRIRDLNVSSFSSDRVRERLVQSFEERRMLALSVLGLVLSGSLLVLLLIRESARNHRLALHDPLTRLPNRKHFTDKVAKAERDQSNGFDRIGVLIIDLNNFKEINDTYGHDSGDELLRVIARRLRGCVREQELVARLGGDEFAVLLRQQVSPQSCSQLAHRLCESITQEVRLGSFRVRPSASIGVSIFPDDGQSLQDVIVNADMAMYRAKQDYGASYRLFEPSMTQAMRRIRELSKGLEAALEDDQLQLHYQPIVDLSGCRIQAVEAVLCWQNSDYGLINAAEIEQVAEESGMAGPLGEWVLERVGAQYTDWLQQGIKPIQIAVNLSASMLWRQDLLPVLEQLLKRSSMPAYNLMLEIREETVLRSKDSAVEKILQLKQYGIEIALDDFGTGYSSLSHLRRLPLDKLKIDPIFIQDLNKLNPDLRFIRSLLSMAESLSMTVVAEGIDAERQWHDLAAEGCRQGQGELFGPPMMPDRLATLLLRQQQDPDFGCLVESTAEVKEPDSQARPQRA
ncbi:EAL domain-containing protein [Motiliproteus coralliicola]|uniref:EAL domain-containing protein n=1 Tax=Motiliproteus coralliicola TaxID=2283196 RepID=A0A369WU50_9GAMM|nr:EAL domain-containing protein [Motiliproteus coralliicola]RDE25187.1 EAL domain-containing protein [Motiliproteus coralliicola]